MLFIDNRRIENELEKFKIFLLLPSAHQSLDFRIDTRMKDYLLF